MERVVLVVWMIFISYPPAMHCTDNDSIREQGQALVDLKSNVSSDPTGILNSWNLSISHNFCNWRGISCPKRTRLVTKIDLSEAELEGQLPANLGLLKNLKNMSLHNNSMKGSIPSSLGYLAGLEWLDLSYNKLEGSIPSTFGEQSLNSQNKDDHHINEVVGLLNLTTLDLSSNNIGGSIPKSVGNLKILEFLSLGGNKLSGEIPAELGNITNLRILGISSNNLSGEIPDSLVNLTNLMFLDLSSNNLSGKVPDNLGDKITMDLSDNPYLCFGSDCKVM